MRASVGQSEHRMTSGEEFCGLVFDVVENRHPEARFEVRGQREIEREVDRIEASLVCNFIQVALFERRIGWRERNHRAIPSVGERTARALACLGFERTAELR